MKRQNGTGVWIGAWVYGGLYFQYYASVIRQLNVTVFKGFFDSKHPLRRVVELFGCVVTLNASSRRFKTFGA